jgi:hypothetical protein
MERLWAWPLRRDRLLDDRENREINGDGQEGYIKRPNSLLAPQDLRLNHLPSTCLYKLYIYHHHGLVRRRPRQHSGLQFSELVLCQCDVCCVVLIATGSSTTMPPSTSLTSVMSSLLLLLPTRFAPVVSSFPAIFKHALGCQGIRATQREERPAC